VGRLEASGRLEAQVQGFSLWQGASPGERLREQLAPEALSNNVDQPIIGLPQVMYRSDIRVLDLDRLADALPQHGERERERRWGA